MGYGLTGQPALIHLKQKCNVFFHIKILISSTKNYFVWNALIWIHPCQELIESFRKFGLRHYGLRHYHSIAPA